MSETTDLLSRMLNGQTPVRRQNPQPGQSEWYYIDPRGRRNDFTLLTEMNTIDVDSPNAPNPVLGTAAPATDQQLLQRTADHLYGEEQNLPYIYLDTKGYKTTGVGANIDNWDDFRQVKWQQNGHPADEASVRQAFDDFEALKQNQQYGQSIVASDFEDISNLRIDDNEAKRLLNNHLQQDLAGVKQEVPGFEQLPAPLQEVLLDIKYNTGNVRQENWPQLHDAIRRKDLNGIKSNVHRRDVGAQRNAWAAEQIDKINGW